MWYMKVVLYLKNVCFSRDFYSVKWNKRTLQYILIFFIFFYVITIKAFQQLFYVFCIHSYRQVDEPVSNDLFPQIIVISTANIFQFAQSINSEKPILLNIFFILDFSSSVQFLKFGLIVLHQEYSFVSH